jgi:hypothetical protein
MSEKSHPAGFPGVAKEPRGVRQLYKDFRYLKFFALPVFYYLEPSFDLDSRFWKTARPSDYMAEFSALLSMQGLMGAMAILLNAGPPLILRQWAVWCWDNMGPEDELGRLTSGARDPNFLRALRRVRLAPGEELGVGIGGHDDPEAFEQFLRALRRMPVPPEASAFAPRWASMFEEYSLGDLSLPFVMRFEDVPSGQLPTKPHPGHPKGRLSWAVQRFAQLSDTWSWKGFQAFLVRLLANSRMPQLRRELLALAIRESLLFERFGWVISRCQHGDHWYVSDDKRRKDCVVHRLAGQQARWRSKHPRWKLSVKSRSKKKASAQRKPRPRSRV